MSLSDRFAKMKPQPQAAGRANRQLSQTNSVKDNRNKQVQGKRGVQQSAPTSAGNGRGKGKGKGKPGERNIGSRTHLRIIVLTGPMIFRKP